MREGVVVLVHSAGHDVAEVLDCTSAGETWQATLDDGSNVYFEQISHHPPVSAFSSLVPVCTDLTVSAIHLFGATVLLWIALHIIFLFKASVVVARPRVRVSQDGDPGPTQIALPAVLVY